MTAKIIPLKRLPRGLELFDYSIPDEIKKDIKPGQLVKIPLKKSQIFGIIFDLKKSVDAPKNIKPIEEIVNTNPLFNSTQLKFAEKLSQIYGVSIGTIGRMMTPPLQKRKLSKEEWSDFKKTTSQKTDQLDYFLYQTKKKLETFLKKIKQNTLILVPEVNDIEEVLKFLNKDKVVVWNSKLSQKEQFTKWFEIRGGKKNIILGTRGSVFLPFQNLEKIIILNEHDENLKHWDQTPRFHSEDMAKLLCKLYGCSLTLASFSPSSESYYHITKGHYNLINQKLGDNKILFKPTKNLPTIIDVSEQYHQKNHDTLADSIEENLEKPSGDVFLFINRKGFATVVRCGNCGHIETCPKTGLPLVYMEKTNRLKSVYTKFEKTIPLHCPKCHSTMIKLGGIGTEAVMKELTNNKKISDNYNISVIDKDHMIEKQDNKKTNLFIGTQVAFKNLDWDKLQTVVFLDVDRQLAIPEFNECEKVWNMIQEVLFRKDKDCKFYIQTTNPDHFMIKSIGEPDRFYRLDLNLKQAVKYPPYKYLTRYFLGDRDYRLTRTAAMLFYTKISQELTKNPKSIILSNPIEMHPRFYRGKYWFVIAVKLNPATWYNDLMWLNNLVPGKWKIDPNPISLLSP